MSDKRKYRKFTPKQKVELVLASFRGDRSVAEICREHDLSEALLRRWRDQMIEAGAERYQDGQDRSVQAEQRRRIAELERALGKKGSPHVLGVKGWPERARSACGCGALAAGAVTRELGRL